MKLKTILFILICQLAIPALFAQNDVQVKNIFEQYGKRKGSIMIQLSTDILSPRTRMSLYKSLVVKQDEDIVNSLGLVLDNAAKQGTKLTEISKSGRIENAAYYIEVKNSADTYDYILYNESKGQITFVYMRGNFPPKELDKELKKLKDLFIYINK